MKRLIIHIFILLSLFPTSARQISYSVEKIWGDDSIHCAFTSLIKFNGRYYCAFREGASHIFDNEGNAEGRIRIISSKNGKSWKSVALVGKKGCDFRDPKLSVMPDGRILVTFVASIYRERQLLARHPYVMYSSDGMIYSAPELAILNDERTLEFNWIWRVTWHGQTGYAVSYNIMKEGDRELSEVRLLETSDGRNYNVITKLDIDDYPNETTIRFTDDGRMTALVRRERGDYYGWFGVSDYPFNDWDWKSICLQIGGPDYLYFDDNFIIMCTRNSSKSGSPKTIVYKGSVCGDFEEILVLPSGGDCSYPGLLVVGDELWISYYSSHETERAAIYLAKIPLSVLRSI